ncbi:hypothetical protein TNIN_265651 [Trichonephila inaurata madagascariensis]|uniref:Uncharacterized protein n=1 Tax=Trichonephila inaurata madagascariensis TaxID=2747483 RepID=A0A8X7BNU1_9ARAC|nr:hypothetical protein TNIN_265651 [Trichonephila inaurata madagascariensis]
MNNELCLFPESVIIKQKPNRHCECSPPRDFQNCETLHPTDEPRQTRGQDNQTECFHGQKKVIREEERMRWRLRGSAASANDKGGGQRSSPTHREEGVGSGAFLACFWAYFPECVSEATCVRFVINNERKSVFGKVVESTALVILTFSIDFLSPSGTFWGKRPVKNHSIRAIRIIFHSLLSMDFPEVEEESQAVDSPIDSPQASQ